MKSKRYDIMVLRSKLQNVFLSICIKNIILGQFVFATN